MRTRVEIREKFTFIFTNSNKTEEETLGKNIIMDLIPGQLPKEFRIQTNYNSVKIFKLTYDAFELKEKNGEVQYVARYTLDSKQAFNYNNGEKERFLHSYCGEMGFTGERSISDR